MEFMIVRGFPRQQFLVKATAAINVLGNLFGALLTLIYFGIFYPGLTPGSVTGSLPAMSAIIIAVWISAVAVIGPINMSWVIPLAREVKKKLQPHGNGAAQVLDIEGLRVLAGNLLKLPTKLAGTTLTGWVIAAVAFFALAHILPPELYPWTHDTSGRVSASMVLIAAPLTASWIFFFQERWIRIHMRKFLSTPSIAGNSSHIQDQCPAQDADCFSRDNYITAGNGRACDAGTDSADSGWAAINRKFHFPYALADLVSSRCIHACCRHVISIHGQKHF